VKWERQGLVFRPADHGGWLGTHAQLPVALPLDDGRHRVYFASRDERQRSRVGWVELDLAQPQGEQVVSPEPVLEPGPLGHFDDHGVYPASLVAAGDDVYLYTIGWNPAARAPLFYASIGLAVSTDGGRTFEKHGRAPIMARGEHDPCLVTAPCVLRDDGRWRMWYVSGLRWVEEADGLHSYYHVKYAESDDGISWRREGRVCVDLEPGERNIARPCVVRDGDRLRMWFSYDRGEGYRLGYAESDDGLVWERRDVAVALVGAGGGFDSDAQCYPWMATAAGRRVLLYNGNGFGRDGFGAAVAAAEDT